MRGAALRARLRIAAAIRRSLLAALGAGLALVGLGFFTAALWLGLAAAGGPVVATLALGGLYVLAAAICFAVAARERWWRVPPDPYRRRGYMPAGEMPPRTAEMLLEAARLGLEAGRMMREAWRRR